MVVDKAVLVARLNHLKKKRKEIEGLKKLEKEIAKEEEKLEEGSVFGQLKKGFRELLK